MHWELDPVHTQLGFAVQHMTVAIVKGRFTRFTGDFELDEHRPDLSRFVVTIDAASIQTDFPERDTHIRSTEFLDSAQYPTLSYTSRSVEPLGFHHYHVLGALSLHGVTMSIPLEVSLHGIERDPSGQRHAGCSVRAKINQEDFALAWTEPTIRTRLAEEGIILSQFVQVEIEAELIERLSDKSQKSVASELRFVNKE